MRVTTREELAGTVDEVHALLTDPAFQEAKCAATTDDADHFSVDVGGGPRRASGCAPSGTCRPTGCPTSRSRSSAST